MLGVFGRRDLRDAAGGRTAGRRFAGTTNFVQMTGSTGLSREPPGGVDTLLAKRWDPRSAGLTSKISYVKDLANQKFGKKKKNYREFGKSNMRDFFKKNILLQLLHRLMHMAVHYYKQAKQFRRISKTKL
jgi:hypothetical protein